MAHAQADANPDLFDKTEHNHTPQDEKQRTEYENDARNFADQYYDVDPAKKNDLTLEQAEKKIKEMMPESGVSSGGNSGPSQ